jgi:glycosyltransferase involved in cell wall biosynthesis
MDLLEEKGHPQVIIYSDGTDKTITKEGRREYHLPGLTSEFNRDMLGKLDEIIRAESPDIIFLHNVHNIFAIEHCVKQKPTIRYVHDPSLCCFTHWKLLPGLIRQCNKRLGLSCFRERCLDWDRKALDRYLGRKRELRLHKKLKKVIVASQYMKRLLVQNGFPAAKIAINPYFVTSPPAYTLPEPAGSKGGNTIFYAGLIHKIKGIDLMLRALSLIKHDFTALLAGTGAYLDEYRKMAIDLGLGEKVKFLGWVPNTKLMEYFNHSDLVLVPSFWVEAFAIVGIEAMSCAKPVIGFDSGGISEWLKNDVNGFLVPVGSYREMAMKIDVLLENRIQRRAMGIAGRRLYEERFTKETHVSKLLDIFDGIIKRETA